MKAAGHRKVYRPLQSIIVLIMGRMIDMMPRIGKGIALGITALLLGPVVHADQNGKLVLSPMSCGGSVFSSIGKICELVSIVGEGSCKITDDRCVQASQEIFTGNNIELATPATANIKNWSGFGGMGEVYNVTTSCLLRDLSDMPGKKVSTQATASSPLGDITAKQEIGFLSYDKNTRVFEGYHRLQACAPAAGCLDAYTQKFRLTPVKTNLKGAGKTAGMYEVFESHAMDLWSEGQFQGLKVELSALKVSTPYGSVSAKPEFGFGRATGFVVSPYDGSSKSSVATPLATLKTIDTYGRVSGTDLSNTMVFINHGDGKWESQPAGWMSQIALGTRDPNPKGAVWKPAPGVEFPIRPDGDIAKARSAAEKVPGAYLGAAVKIAYSPIDLLPGALTALCGAKPVSLCIEQFEVYAKPRLDTAFSSQINLVHAEGAKWNGVLLGTGASARADLRPVNLDQYKQTGIYYGAGAASRFALEAGVDFRIHLHISIPIIDDIDKTLVDLHPKTTVAETIDAKSVLGGALGATSQASQIMATKQPFQSYTTFMGPKNGGQHLKECLAKPSAQGSMPPEPSYSPGDTSLLLEGVEYPCNICVGHPTVQWTDELGKSQEKPGQVWTLFAASQSGKPDPVRWMCSRSYQIGCFDMCTFNPGTKELKVIRTAPEMIASGEMSMMPRRCR